MRRFLVFFPIVIALALPAAAMAQNNYVGVGGMIVLPEDSDLTDSTLPGVSGALELGNSGGFTAAVGTGFGNGFRGEAEFLYQRADIEDLTLSAFGLSVSTGASGDVTVVSGMANVLYDFTTRSKLKPYVGAGIGLANVNVDISVVGASAEVDDTVFAYQLMAGAQFDITNTTAFRAGYRYFGTSDPEFDTTTGEYHSHLLEVEVVFKF